MNVFNDKSPIAGQQIICAYEDCGQIFNEVYCPSCEELNPYQGNFSFGKVYKCYYAFCNKNYQFFVCPCCSTYSRTTDSQEGKKYYCNSCNTLLACWECPFCKKTIMDKNSSFEFGQMVRCPGCKSEYSFCRCYECQKLIFSEKNQFIFGVAVRCQTCSKYSVNVVCSHCNTKISIMDRVNDMENREKIKCGNCEKVFEYIEKNSDMLSEDEIYSQNLSILGYIKGEAIPFGKGEVDEKHLLVENNLFIKSNLYDDSKTNNTKVESSHKHSLIIQSNQLCILCHCNTKESVFYPCGHRCVCYKCAVYYFEMYKKCPKCGKNSEAIVPKIYEIYNNYEKKI